MTRVLLQEKKKPPEWSHKPRTFFSLVSFLLRLQLMKPSDLRIETENNASLTQLTELTATTHHETLYILHRTTQNISFTSLGLPSVARIIPYTVRRYDESVMNWSNRGLIFNTMQAFAWRNWGKPQKIPGRADCLRTDIRTRYLTNTMMWYPTQVQHSMASYMHSRMWVRTADLNATLVHDGMCT
jgi:hypothetical protein